MGFQGFILRLLGSDESLSLQNNLINLLQIFFSIIGDRKCGSRDNSNGKVYLWGFSKLVKQLISELKG